MEIQEVLTNWGFMSYQKMVKDYYEPWFIDRTRQTTLGEYF